MDPITAIAIFVMVTITIVVIAIVIFIKTKQDFLDSHTADRPLSDEDIEAINYLEIQSNLSFSPIRRELKSKSVSDQIYRFANCSFTVQERRMHKGPYIYYFYIEDKGKLLQVRLPDVLLSHFKVGESFSNVNIEIIFRANTCWLFNLDGHISYVDLYKQFHLQDTNSSSLQILSKRPITKEEKSIFMFSKWSSTWSLTLVPILPFIIYGLLSLELAITIIMLIPAAPLLYLTWRTAKKRGEYIASREVYTLKGDLSFDEESGVFSVGDKELLLHPKWLSALEGKKTWRSSIEMDAFMHTFDSWNEVARQRFQPIRFKGGNLNINEAEVGSTRGWVVAAMYLAVLAPLLFISNIDSSVEDVFYGYRTSHLPRNFSSMDDLYSSPLQHRQNISIKALAIPLVRTVNWSDSTEVIYHIDGDGYFFPRNEIENYQESLGLDQIEQLMTHFKRIQEMEGLFSSFGGVIDIPLYKRIIDIFFNDLAKKDNVLDRYSSYQALKKINRQNYSLALFKQHFEELDNEVSTDLESLANEALHKLHEYGQGEGVRYYTEEYGTPWRYEGEIAFISLFPREELLEGAILINDNKNKNYVVSKHSMDSTSDLVRAGIQILLWLALLFIVLYLLKLVWARLKGNYFYSGWGDKK